MKTTFDAVDVFWKRLNEFVKPSISGAVYKLARPLNSTTEDIVINSLPISTDFPQKSVVNINCYVPDISVKVKGNVSAEMPDTKRLNEIAKFVNESLDSDLSDKFHYYIQGQTVLSNEAGKEYYVNIRAEIIFTETP